MNLDSVEVRRSAKAMQQLAGKVDGNLLSQIKKISGKANEALTGEAGDVLIDMLKRTEQAVKKSSDHLESCAQAMFRYAEALEELDRRSKEIISNN